MTPEQRSLDSASRECGYFHIFSKKTKRGIHRPVSFTSIWKTLFGAEERGDWRSCLARQQRLNLSVIPRQSTSVPEEARPGHQRNIRFTICACVQMWEREDVHAKSPFLSLKVIPQFCIAHPYCARYLRHQRARVQNVRDFPQIKLDSEINARFLLNEHGDPQFLFHQFNENNILIN